MILDHFPPNFTPRPLQVDVLNQVEAAFATGVRYVVVEAPPGVGKTLCTVTTARWMRDAWICTVTKQLQAQILRDFEDIGARELRGRGSYQCERLEEGSCELGAEKFRKDPCRPHVCPYRLAKAEAMKSPLAVCNYYSYLYNVGVGSFSAAAGLKPLEDPVAEAAQWVRPLLVCDEAHRIEDMLLRHVSITVDASALPIPLEIPFPDSSDMQGCFAWLQVFLMDANDRLAAEEEHETLTPKARKELMSLIRKAEFALEHREAEEWIAEPLDANKVGFVLKPLTVRSFTGRIFKYGEKVLLMSATILDVKKFTESLGIQEHEYVFIRTDCPFPVSNRTVITGDLNMTQGNRARAWPVMVDQVRFILDYHQKDKGLLLTTSNEMLDYILQNLPSEQRRRLIPARGVDRMVDYQRHIDAMYPSVLAAPGFWEGADLRNELARFAILPAVPRAYWAGQVAARATLDPDWYRLQSYQQLIQGVGRTVRNEHDYSTTYVLDRDLRLEAQRANSLLPQWFKDGLLLA